MQLSHSYFLCWLSRIESAATFSQLKTINNETHSNRNPGQYSVDVTDAKCERSNSYDHNGRQTHRAHMTFIVYFGKIMHGRNFSPNYTPTTVVCQGLGSSVRDADRDALIKLSRSLRNLLSSGEFDKFVEKERLEPIIEDFDDMPPLEEDPEPTVTPRRRDDVDKRNNKMMFLVNPQSDGITRQWRSPPPQQPTQEPVHPAFGDQAAYRCLLNVAGVLFMMKHSMTDTDYLNVTTNDLIPYVINDVSSAFNLSGLFSPFVERPGVMFAAFVTGSGKITASLLQASHYLEFSQSAVYRHLSIPRQGEDTLRKYTLKQTYDLMVLAFVHRDSSHDLIAHVVSQFCTSNGVI